ncbi:MAG: IMS domain-containing protein [Leptodesmis sp.]|uniref:IMS domain-containing protein n=1 Tax=Leptodesmis sp. TaxID=3100501 RepID=UPI003D13CC64
MRIPLDYYRILGLPIQATSEQLRQAHRDRTLQLPRREYSEAAISARKKLLDQAYAALSDPTQRQQYDASFLAKTYDLPSASSNVEAPGFRVAGSVPLSENGTLIDPHTPSIEIDEDQFIGALLILQELGEYELVLKLGRPFLTGGSASLRDGYYGDPNIVFSDIVLTVALACLELGREQWQQGQYENAAEALETGRQLLLREGLFVGVRGEIQADLYRLRPYRILELLAASEDQVEERQRGMDLLEEMLNERQGIDGTESDQSGLNVDDFLRFIQQIRSYLTAEEQQLLFEQEANRPSAVATYLAVYAILARGFATRQPELVYRAKQYLSRLSGQDVHLEQAVCSLLLGQTEQASQMLEQSQEQDSIAFIRHHSQDSPDLLPGLCLYTERWLQDEVFPHFRDLSQCRVSLKDYFADRQVQTFLETLPDESGVVERDPQFSSVAGIRHPDAMAGTFVEQEDRMTNHQRPIGATHEANSQWGQGSDRDSLIAAARARIASRTSENVVGAENRFVGGVTTAERVTQDNVGLQETPPPRSEQRVRTKESQLGEGGGERPESRPVQHRLGGDRPARPRPPGGKPPWLMPALAILGVVLLGLILSSLVRGLQQSAKKAAQDAEKPLVQLDKPLLESPQLAANPVTAATLDKESAKQILDSWLSTKAKVMGPNHEVALLDQILLDPKLAEWKSAAEEAKRDNWYRTYKHDIKIDSVELISSATGQPVSSSVTNGDQTASGGTLPPPTVGESLATDASPTESPNAGASPPAPDTAPSPSPSPTGAIVSPVPTTSASEADQARVVATVTETTETFRDGQSDGTPQTENLRVQYTLIRKDGKWFVQDWQVQ